MPGPLALSPTARPVLSRFGAERQPLLTLDDALPSPEAVVAIAARHKFAPIGPFYPGVRAVVPETAANDLIAPLNDTLRETFGLAMPPVYFECFLSLVTVPPRALAPIQRLPHFDGLEPDRIAVLLYLDRSETSGTAFYRLRGTEFESVDQARYDSYRRALDAGVAEHGLPPPAYIAGDTSLFEQTHTVAGQFNRLIAYRGNTLHCAMLGPEFVPNPDPAQGRLTLNLFLRAPTP